MTTYGGGGSGDAAPALPFGARNQAGNIDDIFTQVIDIMKSFSDQDIKPLSSDDKLKLYAL